jgi:integrase
LFPEPNKTPKERKRNSNDPLTKHEVEQLLSKIDNLKDYTLLLFGFSSGVRVGELSFDYNSINWQEAYISIWDEKKDKYRKVYVPESVLNSLRRYWNERVDRKSPKFFDISADSRKDNSALDCSDSEQAKVVALCKAYLHYIEF